MTYETVKFDVRDDGIATMTLNRPEKLNAFTRVMFREWEAIIERCVYDDAIKVLVVAGEGRAFSSGSTCHFSATKSRRRSSASTIARRISRASTISKPSRSR